MKSLITALVLSAASVLPVSAAGIHDFNEQNARPSSPSVSGKCVTMADKSSVCFQKFAHIFTIAINDVDKPRTAQSVVIDCSTGKWTSFGGLSKDVLTWYMDDFCKSFN